MGRESQVQIRVSIDEKAALVAAAPKGEVSTWLRDLGLKAAGRHREAAKGRKRP